VRAKGQPTKPKDRRGDGKKVGEELIQEHEWELDKKIARQRGKGKAFGGRGGGLLSCMKKQVGPPGSPTAKEKTTRENESQKGGKRESSTSQWGGESTVGHQRGPHGGWARGVSWTKGKQVVVLTEEKKLKNFWGGGGTGNFPLKGMVGGSDQKGKRREGGGEC